MNADESIALLQQFMAPCGCKVSIHDRWITKLEFCRLHKMAPEMKEALDGIKIQLEGFEPNVSNALKRIGYLNFE